MSDTGVIVTLSPRDCDAVLFDLDGVLTRTASVHAAAWKKLFGALHLPSATVLERPSGPHRRVEWRVFDLAKVKALGRQLGGKVNDVVLAILTGAMRRFLERRGERLESIDYRVVVPVNMRSPSR